MFRYRYQSTMVIIIGQYRQNFPVSASKKGGIKIPGTLEEPGTAASAMKSKAVEEEKDGKPQTPLIFCVRYQLMLFIKISHYELSITLTGTKNGCIKCLGIIDERGTGFYRIKPKYQDFDEKQKLYHDWKLFGGCNFNGNIHNKDM